MASARRPDAEASHFPATPAIRVTPYPSRSLATSWSPGKRRERIMCDTNIEDRPGADLSRGPNGRRPSRIGGVAGLIGVLAAAGAVLLAVPGTAQAATTAGPSASFSFATASISSGTKPVVTYITADLPAGSTIYLQRAAGTGGAWQSVGRMTADSGTVRAPADPAGQYRYRILIAQGSTTVTTSAAGDLTVTGTSGGSGGTGCSSCTVAEAVLPWLAPVIEPIIESVAQQIGSAVLAVLGAIFGF